MGKRRGKPYHLRYHGDALGGYETLSLEERGAYTTLLDQMYDHGGPIRDDVRNACAWLNCDVRVWKRLRAALVDHHRKLQAYTDAQGRSWLVNDRAQGELKLPTYAELTANLGDKLPIGAADVSPKSVEKVSDNNGRGETKTPENATLIPLPIPKTPIGPQGDGGLFGLEPPDDEPPPVDEAQAAFALWNETARRCGLPVARFLDDGRRKAIRKRLDSVGLDVWREALEAVEVSAFCRGLRPGSDNRIFKADLTFVCQARSFQRLIEGYYGADAEKPVERTDAVAASPESVWSRRLAEFERNKFWNRLDWGPQPGRPGCLAPAEALEAFGFTTEQAA